ncbi:hypothetical protein E0J16_34140 [Rhizobium pisi]|uniref:hypothetical protein n=1 Tax=Rhizobium pisi TaxID=574561 RepID=UPI001038AB44|nr:hypothetical protein [Rhizobium pisi]TCA41731.1 hypothetical protein E0J16_34140 [Rhizobium pisi]
MAPAIRVEIEKKHIDEAIERARTGVSKEESYYYGDRLTSGLQLRVQGRQAFWALKYYNFTKTIGYAYPAEDKHLPSVSAARKLAAACKDILDDDPKMLEPMLVKYYGGADRDVKKAKKEMVAVSTGWTVEETAEAMIAARTKPDTDDPIKKSTVAQFRLTLRRPQVKALSKKPIADVTKADLDAVKREMEKSPEGASMIKKFVSDIRSILTWGATHATDMTSLDPSNIWWELVKSGKKKRAITRSPIVDDIVKTLILAESYLERPLPGRFSEGKFGVGHNVLNALWWLALSAQRTTAGTRLRLVDFFPDPKRLGSGWYLAFWAEGETKNGKAFVLPVPPRAAGFLQERMAKAKRNGDSQWCFPSSQARGKIEIDIPVDRNSPGGVTERMAVRDYPTKDKIAKELAKNAKWESPYVDLLAENDIMYWSPHDVRRTIVEVLEEHGIPGGASAVLAHEVRLTDDLLFVDNARNREQYLELRVSRVTKLAYGAGGFIPLKSKAMEVWTNTLIDRYEELHSTYRQARKKAQAERVLKAIYSDANSAAEAKEAAYLELPKIRRKLEDNLTGHKQMLSGLLKKTPPPDAGVRTARIEIELAQADLDAFNTDPASYAIEPSRRAASRTHSAVLQSALKTDEKPVDLVVEAPAYTQLRDQFIADKIDVHTFRLLITERYPITLDMMDDRIITGMVTGDEAL